MSKWDEYGFGDPHDEDTGRYQRSADEDVGINRKAFKGKYLDNITEGIKTRYSSLYPGKEICVRYEKEGQANYFEVYVEGPAFHFKPPYNQRIVFLYIDKYSNNSAIEIFATLPKQEFYEKYDDYKADNIAWLREQLNALSVASQLRGVTITKIQLAELWNIEWTFTKNLKDGERRVWSYDSYVDGQFDKMPISMATAKSVLRRVKAGIDNYIKKGA